MAAYKSFLKSFSWVFVENISLLGVQFISTIVLSRILSPADYGLLGIITIFMSLSNILVDSGMGGSLIKKKKVENIDYSTLFIYNHFVSLILYLILFFTSDYIGDFYHQPVVSGLIKVIGIVIIINGITIVQSIRLIKELNFKTLAISSFISSLISFIIALIFAYQGCGVWTLVIQQISQAVLRMLFLICANRYIPRLKFSVVSFREQFSFGINLLASNILYTIYNNINSSIIAKVGSVQQTGYYVQASRLQAIPTGIISSVIDKAIYPIFTQCSDTGNLKQMVIRSFSVLSFILLPIIFFTSALSEEIIIVLFGERWLGAAIFLKILIFACIGIYIQYIMRNVLKALGHTKIILKLEVIKTIAAFLLLIIAILLDQVLLIAISVVITSLVSALMMMAQISKRIDYKLSTQFTDIYKPFLICICSYVFVVFTKSLITVLPIFKLLICLLEGTALYLIVSYLSGVESLKFIISKFRKS